MWSVWWLPDCGPLAAPAWPIETWARCAHASLPACQPGRCLCTHGCRRMHACMCALLQGGFHGRTYGAMALTSSKTIYRQVRPRTHTHVIPLPSASADSPSHPHPHLTFGPSLFVLIEVGPVQYLAILRSMTVSVGELPCPALRRAVSAGLWAGHAGRVHRALPLLPALQGRAAGGLGGLRKGARLRAVCGQRAGGTAVLWRASRGAYVCCERHAATAAQHVARSSAGQHWPRRAPLSL